MEGENYFVPLRCRNETQLFNGVMAAQQILVLFVQVRVLVEQQKKSPSIRAFSILLFTSGCGELSPVSIYLSGQGCQPDSPRE